LFCFSRGFGKIYKIAFKKSGRNRLARGKNGKGPAKNEKQRQRFSMPYHFEIEYFGKAGLS